MNFLRFSRPNGRLFLDFGDIALSPFLGSDTTAVAAKELGRQYIGIEHDDTYVKVAKQRIDKIIPLNETLVSGKLEAKAPRVTFGLLVNIGLIKAGATLTSKDDNRLLLLQTAR